MAKLILASASPRRSELLRMLNIPFEIRPADVDERLPDGILPGKAVEALARRKAEASASGSASEVILAADTLVAKGDQILGKPVDAQDAVRMLTLLSGAEHQVYSGIALIRGDKIASAVVCTAVRFRKLTEGEILRYVATGDPLDKAGAYGIQGPAGIFIEAIEGDYYNVVGLPICVLEKLAKGFLGCSLYEIPGL